jgi:hypothetical protein
MTSDRETAERIASEFCAGPFTTLECADAILAALTAARASSPPSPGLVEAARLAMPFVEAAAEEQQSYGYFLSGLVNGDPRAFSPDPECATPEELAQHKADCEAWDRCERPVHVTMQTIDPERSIARQLKGANSAMLIRDGDGNVTGGHVHRAGYGLGVTVFRDADAVTALDALCAALPKEPAGR